MGTLLSIVDYVVFALFAPASTQQDDESGDREGRSGHHREAHERIGDCRERLQALVVRFDGRNNSAVPREASVERHERAQRRERQAW